MDQKTNSKRINLIPSELAVSPKTVKLTKTIAQVTTFGVVALFLTIATTVSIFVYFKLQINKTNEVIESLKVKIIALESSEQKLVITKDRLSKIGIINKTKTIKDDIINFQDIQNLITNSVGNSLSEVDIQKNNTEFSVTSNDSTALESFLAPLAYLDKYENMVLTSLGFSSKSGFLSTLTINSKK